MDAFFALFIFGTLWWWILAAALFVLVLVFESNDDYIGAGVCALIFVFFMNLSGALPDFSLMSTIVLIVAYFVIGVVWSGVKWYLFLRKRHEKYKYLKSAYEARSEKAQDFNEYLRNEGYLGYGSHEQTIIPLAADNKDKIIGWMSLWPWSALWTLLNDPFQWLYRHLKKQYQKMADSVFADA